MAGTTIGTAYVQILPSAEGIGTKLKEAIGGDAEHIGTEIGGKIGSTIVKAIAALGIGKMISNAISNGMDFEQSMAKASTLFSGTSEELAALESQILSISGSTGVAASQLAEAAYSAESASVPMQNLGGMIEASAKLATAGFTDIDTALSATAKTMNAYGMMSDDAAQTQANMEAVQRVLIQTQNKGITTVGELGASLAQVTPTAAAANVSFEQVGAALALMTARGTPTAQATTQLRSALAELEKSGTTASKALEEAAKGTEYAGMSFTEMMANGADLGDVMGMLQSYADKSGKSMLDLWGSIEGGNAAMAIAADLETFNSDLEAMSTSADVVGDAFSTMSDTVSFKLQQVKNSLKNIGIKAFGASADTLMRVLEGVQTILEKIQPSLSKLGSAFSSLFSAFGQALGNLLGLEEGFSTADAIAAGLQAVIEGLATAIQFLADHMDVLMPILAGVAAGFAAFKIGSGIMGIVGLVGKLAAGIAGAGGLIPAIAGLMGPVGWIALAIGAVIAIGVALYQNWDVIKAKAIEIWGTITTWISTKVAEMKAAVTQTWENIKTAVSEVWNSITTAISTAVENIKTTFGEWVSTATTKAQEFVEAIHSGIQQLLTNIGTWIQENLVQPAQDAIAEFVNIGQRVVDNIRDGISRAWDGLASWFNGIWQGLFGNRNVNVNVNASGNVGGYATGLDYVPYDEFPAILHKGEAVLTAAEADVWRRGGNTNGGMTIIQNIQSVPQSPVEIAAATAAMFEQARWAV